jgi:hypothetical protein
LSAFHCIELVETPRFSDLLDEEVEDLLLDVEVNAASSHQLVFIARDGVDGALDSSFPLVELVRVFQLVVVVVEEQVLGWGLLGVSSSSCIVWWDESIVEWAALVIIVVVPVLLERRVLPWEWWRRRWSASAIGSPNSLGTWFLIGCLDLFFSFFDGKVLSQVVALALFFSFIHEVTWVGMVDAGSHVCSACLVVVCRTASSAWVK